jgi:hypothetical protein
MGMDILDELCGNSVRLEIRLLIGFHQKTATVFENPGLDQDEFGNSQPLKPEWHPTSFPGEIDAHFGSGVPG